MDIKHECCEEAEKNLLTRIRLQFENENEVLSNNHVAYVPQASKVASGIILPLDKRKEGEIKFGIMASNHMVGVCYFDILYCPWCGVELSGNPG